ncbi:hfm1 [Hyphodiscus hymeniophilus]|uniref:DNA 3'-5' helicase n=1 Tax=Hyphodiscus hymeniophilus TaxID=353542 RepID=A0A9P6VJA8_9HELO|nr:hfm1 [Hyphodiscus hymeniophilus]
MPSVEGHRYFTSTAVFLNEVIKLAVSLSIAMYDISRTLPPSTPATVLFEQLYNSVFSGDGWKLAIPASLYTLQNSLQYIAVSNLDAVHFQILYQLKILTTALFSVTMLGRVLSSRRWIALVLLTFGVTIVQLPASDPNAYAVIKDDENRFYFPRSFHELGQLTNGAAEVAQELTKRGVDGLVNGLAKRSATYEGIQEDLGMTKPAMNYSIGLSAVLIAAVISGLTGVYFEKVLKESTTHVTVWTRNVQLSFYSLFPALIIGVLFKDGEEIAKNGFFDGYNFVVWTAIIFQAFGGVLVAMCINYADNIAKNFATSISIILSFLFSVWFFDFQVTLNFVIGTALVIFATYLYSGQERNRNRPPPININMEHVPRGMDRHLQRIMDNASRSNSHNRSEQYAFEDHSAEYQAQSAPRQYEDPMLLGSFGVDSSRKSNALISIPDRASYTFQSSRQPSTAASTASGRSPHIFNSPRQPSTITDSTSTRLSLVPQNLYNQQENEPTVITNADNHFRFTQNLRHGLSINRVPPPSLPITNFDDQQQAQSPLTQLANNMFSQRITSHAGPEHPNIYKSQRLGRLSQLQPRRQEATPPFNLSGFAFSPSAQNVASSSPPTQSSSPTARRSLRRANNRVAPSSRAQEDQYDVKDADEDPIALPKTPQRQTATYMTTVTKVMPQALSLGHAPPMANGILLVSPHELSDRFRQVFPYELFNAVQSKCFAPIYKSNDNVVVSAPTGSGKTALLELAICKLIEGHPSGQFKIVYQAPTKSLCSERMRDWQKKFSHLNLVCAELTGDTGYGEMNRVGAASIIVTTPEKWDSITRKWKDYSRLLQMVKLFLIDEVHILKDTRGATLEAVVSRMKTSGADVRFVALSATVPNSQDIAVWLGKDHTNDHIPAHRETFGEEFRPVKLQKHVYGFDGLANEFAFEKVLDGRLPKLLHKHTQHKPIMVFCFTRKSCESTAAMLAEWWSKHKVTDRAWPSPAHTPNVGNKELRELVGCGVAFHHAGLDPSDRHAIETAFLKGDVNVICCTSTLAVGVNLPCHLVILKGTVCFQDGNLCEYSDLEVMQMLGRAGRPQFDDSAIAIIMTRSEKADRYKKMISGQDILESTLHLNLIEHLNSEIGLGTIRDLYTAKKWLTGTFLSVRMRQNPAYYRLDGVPLNRDADERLGLVCERDMKLLEDHELVRYEGDRLSGTEYGQAMSRYMVQFETMKLLLSLPTGATTGQILLLLCQATEFKDLRIKPNERSSLREFNKSPFIKFPIKENISTTAHKISLMIQVQLGGIDMPNEKDFLLIRRQYQMEKNIIFERIQRLIRCIVDCKAYQCDAVATRHALDLARSLSAQFWENSNLQLRQVPQVGPVAHRKLVSSDINSVEKLVNQDTATIERIMGKNPPFGHKTRELLTGFPLLRLASEIIGKPIIKSGQKPKVNVKVQLGFINVKIPVWNSRRPSLTFIAETSQGKLVHFWRGNISKLDKNFDLKFCVELDTPDDMIKCHIACDEIVGTLRYCRLNPDVSASAFPPRKLEELTTGTKVKSVEVDEFGTNDIDDDELVAAVQKVEVLESESDSDGFADIDDFPDAPAGADSKKVQTEPSDSVQMDNGKWTCKHTCRGGKLLKNGHPCKHKCCKEGLDKRPGPRQAKTKSSISTSELLPPNTQEPVASHSKVKMAKNSNSEQDIEIVDLAEGISPVRHSKVARRDYRKLHHLHASNQESDTNSIRLPKQKPRFSYGSGEAPDLPFLRQSKINEDDTRPSSEVSDEEVDLPSPTMIVEFTKESQDDPFESYNPTYKEAVHTSGNNSSRESLEDMMLGIDETTLHRPSTPKVDSSFANGVFDFDAFDNVHDEPIVYSSPPMVRKRGRSRTPPLPDTKQRRLSRSSEDNLAIKIRQQSSTPSEVPVVESRRIKIQEHNATPSVSNNLNNVDSSQPDFEPNTQQPSVPSWVNDFDADLIDSLMGVVEFVD